jgi:chemotaxis methyl-accepting protein methylase
MTDTLQMMDATLPQDPILLRKIARLLEQAREWKSLASVLEILIRINPKDWRTRVRQCGAWISAGEYPESTCEAVVDQVSRPEFVSHARKALLEMLFEQERDVLADAVLKAFAQADAKGLLAYLGSPQGLARGAALWDRLGHLDVPGWDPVQAELIRIEHLEQIGCVDDADRAYAAIEAKMTVEASPGQATPTPSTLMFRNPPLLHCLVSAIAWFIERNGNANVHVAACSTGEEAYSLALLLDDAGLIESCTLNASDVDPLLVRRARTGVVDAKSAINIPAGMLDKRFQRQADGRQRLDASLLKRIEFSVSDLSKPAPLGPKCDLLVANNMLVHFPDSTANEMLRHMVARVQPEGLLCIGGSLQDRLRETIESCGLVPVLAQADSIFGAWRLQRHAWYVNPRPYWALPPGRRIAGEDWRHCAMFARGAETAHALDEVLSAETHVTRSMGLCLDLTGDLDEPGKENLDA